MSPARWKSYKRALKHLFKLLYGAWPTIRVVHRVKPGFVPYTVTIASDTSHFDFPVECRINSSSKTGCFGYLLEVMHEKIDDNDRDWEDDDWVKRLPEDDDEGEDDLDVPGEHAAADAGAQFIREFARGESYVEAMAPAKPVPEEP